ncbi:MAG: DUF1947 domain-containing protein [Thermoplasmata archaeon]|nr:MAG: DUF1947 domain-containing protein [Thermoplasmata archaeon]KAA0007840.1 MAG: DUF1947 domain-containing protein [Thermoplasmata archaeon]
MLKNRHMVSKKEKKEIFKKLENSLGCIIDGSMEIADYEKMKLLIINGKVRGFIIKGEPFLNVEGLKEWKAKKRYVIVDDGAIKHILNGAAVMAAGIIDADEGIKAGNMVWVSDARSLPLAIGIALMNGKEMKEARKGKAVENIHHIGDKIWKISV